MASPSEAPLVTVTLGRLLRALPTSLRVLHPGDEESAVQWVGSSELDDPVPFLVPGEVLLTSGMPFRAPGEGAIDEAAAADRYVAALVRADVRALGIGLAPHHDSTPAAVLEACRRHGLGLFEIPPQLSFAAIGLEFARLMETARARVLRDLHESTRRLLTASMSSRPEHEVLAALVRGGVDWAVLLGADGRVRAGSSPASLEQLEPLLEHVLGASGSRLEVARLDGLEAPVVEAHPLRASGDDAVAALVVGSRQPLDPSTAGIARVTVTVLEVLQRQRQRQGRAGAAGELAARMLLRGGEAGADGAVPRSLVLRSAGAGAGARLRVVMGLPRERDGGAVAAQFWGHLLDTHLVIPEDGGFTAITRIDPSSGAVAEARRRGWLLAIGDPVGVGRLRGSALELAVIRDQLRRSDRSLRAGEQPLSVTSLLGPQVGAALARELLGPLLEPTPEAAEQRRVLTVWLSCAGTWEAAARELDLHRNTVRRQIETLQHELGLDLSDMAVRTDLWVALRFADQAAGSGG